MLGENSNSDNSASKNSNVYNIVTGLSTELSILYFNARSLLPKIDELQAVCLSVNPDIICITESWLSSDIEDLEIELPDYSSIRVDRNRHGGGIVIFYI